MNNDGKYNILVSESEQGIRFDKFIAEKAPDISRSRIKKLIDDGCATLNGKPTDNCSYKVKSGDIIEIIVPEAAPSEMRANETIPLKIAYEDEHFLIIDKQAGLTVHPGAGNHSDTMANALMSYCGDSLSGIGGVTRPGIVHRLDKDTSGLIMVAKNDKAHKILSKQISNRTLKRSYLAICWGVPKPHEGTITSFIGRHPKNRLKMAVLQHGGKEAITHYKVKQIYGNGVASLVECRLQTGRTHQIRVHMSDKGHHLIGDQVYISKNNRYMGSLSPEIKQNINKFNRQALHSHVVGLEHPITGTYMEIVSDMPGDMLEVVNILKNLKNA